jgi:segregation and condensation protein B
MEISNLILHIEALLFASEKPLTALDIVELVNQAFGFMEDKITIDQVEASIDGVREKYASEFYPFELRQSGGGWQFLTKRDYHKTIAQLNGDKFLKRLSNAAIETLAIIAYKQPITKGEIEAIRGVSSDYSVQKLLEKELIVITGRNEQLPGKPLVYTTSRTFMDYFGINSAEELPKINEVLAEQMVSPTLVNAEHFDVEGGNALVVSEDGELITRPEAAEDAAPTAQTTNDQPSLEADYSDDSAPEEPLDQSPVEAIGSEDPAPDTSTDAEPPSESEEPKSEQ